MVHEFLIRKAEIHDLDIIAEGNCLLARETEEQVLEKKIVKDGVTHLLENPVLGFYTLAEENNLVVGQTLITYEWSDWRNCNLWWIQSVYVWPQFRHLGVFSAIFRSIKDKAEKSGVKEIRLYAEKDNTVAHSVYLKLGFASGYYRMYTRTVDGKI